MSNLAQTQKNVPRASKPPSALRKVLAIPEVGILIPLVVFTLIFYVINPTILGHASINAMLRALPFVGVIVVGQAMLIIVGELDLSVGSVAGLCAIVAAYLMKTAGWPVGLSVSAGLLLGAMVGLLNGFITVRLGVPAFITTLGMLYIARGATNLISSGYEIYPLPAHFDAFGRAEPLGISWSFIVCILIVIVGDFILRKTVFGRTILATGGNKEVARIAGINTNAVKIACFAATGALAALGGILLMSSEGSGQPEIGQGWELEVIASTVIGGVSLFGGLGSVTGAFLGLLIMQIVRSGLVIIGVNSQLQTVAVGVIMIVAVGVDLIRRRAKIS